MNTNLIKNREIYHIKIQTGCDIYRMCRNYTNDILLNYNKLNITQNSHD